MEQRDLVLVPFPFSDQKGRKVRPVVIISNNDFNKNSEDALVVGVTSNISKDKYTVNLTTNDLEEGKLSTICCIKAENILKIDKELIIKKIGKVKIKVLENISAKISEIILCWDFLIIVNDIDISSIMSWLSRERRTNLVNHLCLSLYIYFSKIKIPNAKVSKIQ